MTEKSGRRGILTRDEAAFEVPIVVVVVEVEPDATALECRWWVGALTVLAVPRGLIATVVDFF